jgi:CRP/FNR family transcriptional regulator, cyclic AMP receptor protein
VFQTKKQTHLILNLSLPSSSGSGTSTRSWRCRNSVNIICPHSDQNNSLSPSGGAIFDTRLQPETGARSWPQQIDPLYLFACHLAWERHEEPGAGWELISAAHSANSDTRAQARSLLSSSRHCGGSGLGPSPELISRTARQIPAKDDDMKTPYELEIIENCAQCTNQNRGSFCDLAPELLQDLDEISHKMTLPPGAILFVEGQTPRGIFIVCSGRVNLSTTSREGKILILKSAETGQLLGLSATVSDSGYETTAETATPCQVTFVDRKHFLEFMLEHSEVGLHTAQSLSRDYQSAYHDIHDLILTRSSAGKLAKLLLSQSDSQGDLQAHYAGLPMTHEEMAQRIGASRETVTRLLTTLRRKRLIRLDGPRLVIRNRTALEALAV